MPKQKRERQSRNAPAKKPQTSPRQARTQQVAERRLKWARQAEAEPNLKAGAYAAFDLNIGIVPCYVGVGIKVYAQNHELPFVAQVSDQPGPDGHYPATTVHGTTAVARWYGMDESDLAKLIVQHDVQEATVSQLNQSLMAAGIRA